MEKDTQTSTKEMITIPKDDYDDLIEDSRFLDCLRSAGVDNWDGWDFAIERYEEIYGENN